MGNVKLKILLGFITGLLCGALSIVFIFKDEKKIVKEHLRETVYKNRTIRDTIVITENSYIKKPRKVNNDTGDFNREVDSISLINDSTALVEDTNQITDDLIVSESMITSVKVKLKRVEDIDSLDVENVFNVKSEHFANEVNVQFWSSPLQLTGYELSRNTLKLFGFDHRQAVILQVKEDDKLEMSIDTLKFGLKKTDKFISLEL